jgi:FtsP/CotA-like multicopper oxidase with cupredoxin domain
MDEHARTGWFATLVSRRAVLATGAAGLAAPVAMTLGVAAPYESASAQTGTVRKVTMYAEALPGNLYGYGLEPGRATIPGPVLEIYEGDTLEITLVNNTDRRMSIHPHGVDYSVESDGSPLNASFNNPGETRTYTWRSREMFAAAGRRWMPGSAGYWHYHDHAMGTDHGTLGIARGLYGVAPNTPMFEANLGQRVEWIAIGHGNQFHTFHLHAHRWADNRTGMLEGPTDPSRVIDNKDLNPGSSFGFQVLAGEGVGPGAWMYHCHVQNHSETGMSGLFLVRMADGSLPPGAQEAIDRFHGHAHGAAVAQTPASSPAEGQEQHQHSSSR